MAGARRINMVPIPFLKIKEEVMSDDDEDSVACRICSKTFASPIALRNHVRMEHFEAFSTGDPNIWTASVEREEISQKALPLPNKRTKIEDNQQVIKQKTEEILSAMSSGNLMSLASNDVSYIIIKSEDEPVDGGKKRKMRLMKVSPVTERKRNKEPEPITGPFECVQPSPHLKDTVCHQIFFSCCEYSAHYRDEHTRRRKGLRCQVCEKPLAAADKDKAPYPCEVCGSGFNTSKELSEHTSVAHVKLKPFQCSVCQKRFTQQGGVQQHMRMHTGDRPFPCTFCPKSFTQKSGLDQHLRIHTKVKPYRCVICSKTFCQSVHLKQHMRTHTNVSPFQCGICQKRFKQSSHLNYHLRNHNPNNMTEEQQEKYSELMGLISANVVEVEHSQDTETQGDQEQQVQDDQEQQVQEEIELEQVAAESSIQIVEEEEQYIIMSDTPDAQSWRVQMVDS